MSIFEGSNTKLFVCNVTNANAAWTALPNESGGFYHYPQGALNEDAIAAGETVYFIHKNSRGVLSFSRPITTTTFTNPVTSTAEDRIEQITYFGYNGVSGSLDAANSTYYSIRIVLDHTFGMLNNSPLMLTVPYKSDATTTQSEVAAGLAIAATTVLDRQPYKCMKVERVNSGAQATALNNLVFTNGSKNFTSTDDDTATLLVGTILRIEEPENNGSAVTDPCYIVASHDSGAGAARVYTLDQKFQGVTNADHDQCETVTEGNWGLKFTGISVTDANFNPVNDEPFVPSFKIQQSDSFSTATVTYSTNPFIGAGTFQQVAALEAYCQFNNKTREISAYPATVREFETDALLGDGHGYIMHSFNVIDDSFIDVTTGVRPVSKYKYVIAEHHDLTENFDTNLGSAAVNII